MKPITNPTLLQELDSSGPVTDPALLQELEGGPVISAAPPATLWDRAKSFLRDPEKEGARAVQAVVDGEMLGIPPSAALRYREQIDRGVAINPTAATLRSTRIQRVQQAWETGKQQNALGELGYQYIISGDPTVLEKMSSIPLPTPEQTFIPEGRVEEAVSAAAKMMPMMIDTAVEGGTKGLKVGMGFGAISLMLGPEAVPPAFVAGLKVGGMEGAFESAMRKEAGLALSEIIQMPGIDPNIARASAFGIGVVNAGIEVLQLGTLAKTVPGVDKLFSKAITDTLANKALKDRLLSLAGRYAATVATETSQEVAQESTNIVFEELAKQVNNALLNTDIPRADADKIMDRLYETAVESAKGFSVIAAPGFIARSVTGRNKAAAPATDKARSATGGETAPPTDLPKPPVAELAPGISIIGVNEDNEGNPRSYTVADAASGETFDVPVGTAPEEVQARVTEMRPAPVDQQVNKIVEATPETEDAEIQAALGEEAPVTPLEAFRDQVAEVVPGDQADAVASLLEARAAAIGMTADEYIQYHGLEVQTGREFTTLGPGEMVNGITREQAGGLLANGDEAVLEHIEEGIKEHGVMALEDAIRNQIVAEVAGATKGEQRKAVQARIAALEPRVNAIFEKYRELNQESGSPIYSKLAAVAETFPGGKAQSVANLLAKQGVKKAEMEAVGLNEWLSTKKPTDKVTQAELVDFVQANTVELEDVVLDDNSHAGESDNVNDYLPDGVERPDESRRTHFSQYTEPGAVEGSYREMFVTTPVKLEDAPIYKSGREYYESGQYAKDYRDIGTPWKRLNEYQRKIVEEAYREASQSYAIQERGNWQDGHSQYSEVKNPIVRIRFNEVNADGKRILRIEEMQGPNPENQAKMPSHLKDNIYQLGVKRILAYAKENGFDGVALATKPGMSAGQTQNDRYSLSHELDRLDVKRRTDGTYLINGVKKGNDGVIQKDLAENNLEGAVGKDIAAKIIANPSANQTYDGSGLTVSSAGITQLYDTQLPAMLEAYGKGRMGSVVLNVLSLDNGPYINDAVAHMIGLDNVGNDRSSGVTVMPYLPITDKTPGNFTMFQGPKASITFEDTRTIIRAFKTADVSSMVHELGHLFRQDLGGADLKVAEEWAGVKDGEWTIKAEEKFARGFEKYLYDGKAPTEALASLFEKFKTWLANIYQVLQGSSIDVNITPEIQGVFDRLLTEQEQAGTLYQVPERKERVKTRIRRITGQTDTTGPVTERTALKAAFKKAAQAARAAMREGRTKEAKVQKDLMRDMLAKEKIRSANRVAGIMTEKEKAQRRRAKVRDLRDYFGLTDAELRKLSRKDPRLMADYEFKRFVDDMYLRAMELVKTRQARLELIDTIQTKRLQKVDNYRRALGLPTIGNMTEEQLRQFDEALQEFHEGDVFLTQRELETVDRTDLTGIRTWREARTALAAEAGVPIEELSKVKVTGWDSFNFDASLAAQNPFYGVLVGGLLKHEIAAELAYLDVELTVERLAREAEASRPRRLVDRAVPRHKNILAYLEAPEELKQQAAEVLTDAELAYSAYIQEYFSQYLEYLIETQALKKGRDNYFVHMRRTFLENLVEDGLLDALKNTFKNYEQEEASFNILDDNTGNILPLEKFFRFSLHRTGEITPSSNITKAFLVYVKAAEKKRAFDAIIPKMDIYAQSLTPQWYTSRGLEVDASIKKFVNKWINNKKGRHISFDSVLKQGGKLDLALHAARTFTTVLYIGFSPVLRLATFVGEQVSNLQALGVAGFALGVQRMNTKQGRAILERYKGFVGRGAWEEFVAPGKELPERLSDGLFGLFHTATVTANKEFLMASLTPEEYRSGLISTERLARIRIELGRWRAVPGSSSLVGSTSVGKAGTQFKSWAVPILRTTLADADKFVSDLRNKSPKDALTSREAQELARLIGISATVIITGAMVGAEDDDETFIGQLKIRVYKEALTLLQGLDPTTWAATPVILGWAIRFAEAVKSLVRLEEYETKPGYKGVEGLKRSFVPKEFREEAE